MILSVVLVILLFSALVILHEWGHFAAARRNGVVVEEFGAGFPPRAIGRKIGKTVYSLNWLPLGGFVRLKGEDGTDSGPGTFGGASTWVKTKILLAGVGMNALTAYMLILVLCVWGLPTAFTQGFKLPQPTSVSIEQVMIIDISKGSPAASVGLRKGDVIVSANGQLLSSEEDLHNYTKSHAGQIVHLDIKHGADERLVDAQLLTDAQAKDGGYLGVTPLGMQNYRYGISSPLVAASLFGQIIWGTLAGIGQTIVGVFRHRPGTEVAVTGPVGIVVIMSNILYLGLRYLLFFVALVSSSLALINAIPFPALDGGRLFFILLAKLRRKPISPEIEARIHTAGFAFLLILMALITVIDIKRFG